MKLQNTLHISPAWHVTFLMDIWITEYVGR